MPTSLPTARDFHVDALLTDFAIAYGQDLKSSYVADRAATVVRSKKRSNKYPVWNKGDWFRIEMDLRADGDTSAGGGFRLDTSNSYVCEDYALHTYLTDRQRSNAMNEIDAEKAKVRWLMQQAKMKRDKIFASTAFVTGVWTGVTEQTGVGSNPSTNQFLQFDTSGSDPIGVITEQMLAVEVATGLLPNVMISNTKVANELKQHADFLDRIKHTQTGIVTEDLIASVLGLDEYIVAKGVENTAAEAAAASMSRIFGDHILLLHRTPAMTDEMPTALALFSWSEFDQVTEDGAAVAQWYDKDRKATKFEAEQSFDVKITATDLGVMLLNAVG